jgi:hypothetical protein
MVAAGTIQRFLAQKPTGSATVWGVEELVSVPVKTTATFLFCGTPLPTIESFLCKHHDDLVLPHYVYETVALKGSIHHSQHRTLPYSYRETAAIF